MSQITCSEFLRLCKKIKVLILTHENADLDSFASAAILQRYLVNHKVFAKVGVVSHVNTQTEHFAFAKKVSFILNPDLREFEVIVLVDFNEYAQVGRLRYSLEYLQKCGCVTIVAFDHHVPQKGAIVRGKFAVTNPTAVSTTQVVCTFLDKLDARMHEWNCIGILEDTGHFRVGDAQAFASFATSLALSRTSYEQILAFTKHRIPEDERLAFLKAAQRASVQKINGAHVITSELSFYQSAAATKLLEFGADVALVAGKEKNGLTTLSGRVDANFRTAKKFNLVRDVLAPLSKELGGEYGGHSAAAQWKGKAEPKYVLKEAIIILKRLLN